ncbi:MAG: AI-2E family transporter [Candidatus Tectimicrobiota bacterium]
MIHLTTYQQSCLTVILTGVVILILHQLCVLFGIPGGTVLTILIATIFLSAALRRPVNALEKRLNIPRSLTISLIYLSFFALFSFASIQAIPIVASQAHDLARTIQRHWVPPQELIAMLPAGVRSVVPHWLLDEMFTFFQSKVFALVGSLDTFAGTMSSLIGQTITTGVELVLVLILAFLAVREEGVLARYITAPIADAARKQRVKDCIERTMTELGQWANAQLLIGAFFGVGFGGLLWLFGMPYAFTIGLLGLMLEAVIPMVGGLVVLLLATVVGLSHAPLWGPLAALSAYSLAFTAEWHLVYPLTMGRALNIPALVSIVALWIGYYPLGLMRSVLVLPCLVILGNIVQHVWPYAFVTPDQPAAPPGRLARLFWRGHRRPLCPSLTPALDGAGPYPHGPEAREREFNTP